MGDTRIEPPKNFIFLTATGNIIKPGIFPQVSFFFIKYRFNLMTVRTELRNLPSVKLVFSHDCAVFL